MNELHSTHTAENLAILAVSLDQKREEWLDFISRYSPSLINASDGMGWDGKAASDYYIYATPTMFLVDKSLKLIGKPMTLADLNILLKK